MAALVEASWRSLMVVGWLSLVACSSSQQALSPADAASLAGGDGAAAAEGGVLGGADGAVVASPADGPDGGPPLAALVETFASIACERMFTCCTAAQIQVAYSPLALPAVTDRQSCVRLLTATWSLAQLRAETLVMRGRSRYRADQAERCFSALRATDCRAFLPPGPDRPPLVFPTGEPPECRGLLEWLGAGGETCTDPGECASSACHPPASSSSPDIGPPPVFRCAAADACYFVGQPACAADRYCNRETGLCTPFGGEGASCSFASGGGCKTGLVCAAASLRGGQETCRALGAEGAECAADYACGAGLFCNIASLPDGPVGRCAKPGPAGAACSSHHLCQAGLICRFRNGVPAACGPPAKEGEPCFEASECASDVYCDFWGDGARPSMPGTCRARKGEGQTCGPFVGAFAADECLPHLTCYPNLDKPPITPTRDAGAGPDAPAPPSPDPMVPPIDPPPPFRARGTCVPRAADGQSCRNGCQPASYCARDGVCRPRRGEGVGCADAPDSCQEGLTCSGFGAPDARCAPGGFDGRTPPSAPPQQPVPTLTSLPRPWPFYCGQRIELFGWGDDDDD